MCDVLVSAIIPAFRCTSTFCEALNSALAQEVPLEVIIIDDDMVQDCSHLLQPYQQDARVRYFRNDHNLGAAQSRNRGVHLAHGRYVAFLDSDDRWLPGKLQKQLDLLQSTGAALCSTARELIKPNGEATGYVIPAPESFVYRDLLKQNFINCSSVLMPTSIAREFPMRCDEDSHEDYLMWLEVLKKYERGCAVNEPLLQYRISSSGKSGSKFHSAAMTYRTYRHMGFGPLQSSLCFAHYACNGLAKYSGWFFGRSRGKL